MQHQAFLFLLLLQHSKSDSVCKNLRCFADYIRTLSCIWDPGSPGGKPPSLSATWDCGHGGSCDFLPTWRDASHVGYTCTSEQKQCVFGRTFSVTATLVDGALVARQRCSPFQYHENVKPRPPFNLTAEARPGGYNVSWESGYKAYDFLHGELQYQLRYRQKGHPWSLEGGTAAGLKPVLQDTLTVWLVPQELAGATEEYELQVRAGLRESSHYKGTWSNWSPTSRLRTLPRGTTGAAWLVMPLLALSVMVTLVAFLGRQQSCRLWKKLDQFTPSPAPFFQALYLVHHGDFKKWVGTSCSRAPLDISECSTALPEVLRISPKPPALPTTMAPAEEETATPLCAAAPPALPGESPESVPEPAYGHLSIDTVTVADACSLEPEEAYRGLPLDGSPPAEILPPYSGVLLPLPPWHMEPLSSTLYGAPLGASSPPTDRPFWAVNGDPAAELALDLDTVDSGFADSDCGSPVECEALCQGRPASCAAPGREQEEDRVAFLPSYVKQWVTWHPPMEERR